MGTPQRLLARRLRASNSTSNSDEKRKLSNQTSKALLTCAERLGGCLVAAEPLGILNATWLKAGVVFLDSLSGAVMVPFVRRHAVPRKYAAIPADPAV